MTSPQPEPPAPHRRPFAARYRHPGWGWCVSILGVLELFGIPFGWGWAGVPIVTSFNLVVGAGLIAFGIYLLRGQEPRPTSAAPTGIYAATSDGAAVNSPLAVRLAELAKLHADGVITDDEFAAAKARELGIG